MTAKLQINSLSTLYNEDFMLWLENNINLLKNGKFNQLDLENLIEELESMGNSNKDALESNLTILLMHLLKYKYQKNKRSNSWEITMREHRKRIKKAFKNSPSLKPYFNQIFIECYQDARKDAAKETKLSLSVFPTECPFTQNEVLNEDFLPE